MYTSLIAVQLVLLLSLVLDAMQYGNLTFQPCASVWCYTLATDQPLTLSEAVRYTVHLSTTAHDQAVLLDRVVTLPIIFTNASSLLGRDDNELFQTTCDVITNDMKYALAVLLFKSTHSSFAKKHQSLIN